MNAPIDEQLQEEKVTAEVVDARVSVYGDPVEAYTNIAKIWSGVIGHDITPEQVTLMMIGLKLHRASEAPDYSDNSDDIEGYLDIFRKIVGKDMVHARSVPDYIEQKQSRQKGRSAQLPVAS